MVNEEFHHIKALLESNHIETVEQGTQLVESTTEDLAQFQKLIETLVGKPLVSLRRDTIREAFEGFHHQNYLGLWAFCQFGKWDKETQGTTQLRLNQQSLSRIPASIEHLHNLEVVKLNHNRLQDIPESICKLSQLKTLEMNANQITEIPNSINQLIHLENLVLSNNQISNIPETIHELVNIRTIDISWNPISELPESLGKLLTLTKLSVTECPIHSIPQTFKHLTNLEYLDLSLSGYTDTRTPEQRTAIRDTFNHSLVIEFTWDPHPN